MSEQLTYVYAAILDILGYRSRLEADRETGNLTFRNELQRALQVLASINEADYNYQAISDTIIIICNKRYEFVNFLHAIKSIILGFLREGLFVRGGIAYSQHFKSSNITYSHAVSLAHEIESNHALYPRVVIDNNIIKMFYAAREQAVIIESGLICVQNDIYFVDIIDKDNWADVYGYAKDLYIRDEKSLHRKEHEFSKHVWFENYLFSSPFSSLSLNRYIPSMKQLGKD